VPIDMEIGLSDAVKDSIPSTIKKVSTVLLGLME